MQETLNQAKNLAILLLVFGPFILKAGLNIRDARRKAKQVESLDWRSETAKSFTVLWSTIIILAMTFMVLYFFLKAVFR